MTVTAPGPGTACIAVDLLGGDGAPDCVADAIAVFLRTPEAGAVRLAAVGPVDVARDVLDSAGVDLARVELVEASRAVRMDGDPLAELRTGEQVTATVAAALVASGDAAGWVSAGHSGAAVAASALALGRIPGMPVPALAVVLPSLAGPVVLVDAGAAPDADEQALLAFALAGVSYATCLGIEDPSVGLLSIGSEEGKGDRKRKSADALLRTELEAARIRYCGPVEGHDAALGGRAHVIVSDGFSGNVLLKGIEGAVRWAASRMADAYGHGGPAQEVLDTVATSDFAGGLVLGVEGVCVVGHGAGTPREIAACIALAAKAVSGGLVERTHAALADMLDRQGRQ